MTRKLLLGLAAGAMLLVGCRSTSRYGPAQPTIVGTAPVARQAPCCNGAPMATAPAQVPAQVPAGTQLPPPPMPPR
jgi:hypothetical protein